MDNDWCLSLVPLVRIAPSCRKACEAHGRGCAGGVYAPPTPGRMPARLPSLCNVVTCHNVQAPAIEPVYRSYHGSIEGPGLAAGCEGRAPTDTVQPEFSCARY